MEAVLFSVLLASTGGIMPQEFYFQLPVYHVIVYKSWFVVYQLLLV